MTGSFNFPCHSLLLSGVKCLIERKKASSSSKYHFHIIPSTVPPLSKVVTSSLQEIFIVLLHVTYSAHLTFTDLISLQEACQLKRTNYEFQILTLFHLD